MLQTPYGTPIKSIPKPSQPTPGAPTGNAGMAAPPAAPTAPPQPGLTHPTWGGQPMQPWKPPYQGPPLTQQGQANNQPPGEGAGPGFGETYGQQHIGQYDQPSMLEQFAQQQMNGNNPYYDRLRQQSDANINQQMIARGLGSSGGALAALGNADAALYADQFQNMGNLLGAASNIGLNRGQLGFNQAQGIQNLQQNRINSQFNDASQIAGLGAGLQGGFFNQGGQQSGDAAMAGINAQANAAGLMGQGQNANTGLGLDALKGFIARG